MTAELCSIILTAFLLAGPSVEFRRDVAPIFEGRCLICHNAKQRKGGLSLNTAADLRARGLVRPGAPEASKLLRLVAPGPDGRVEMPKAGPPLTPEQIETLRRWIAAGAHWPEDVVLRPKGAGSDWWAYRPLRRVSPPDTPGAPEHWQHNPIDRFVYVRLQQAGLTPSPPTDRRTWLRRVCYDLTGLPPHEELLLTFLNDDHPAAYERVVDRLLASPAYGEQWGRHWLDVARFGESNGFERNVLINNLWPYRDYVIRSFNRDKPFNRFIIEQLAGDVLDSDNPDVAVGTAFLVCGPYDNVGNQDPVQAAIIRANTLDEIIRATAEAFLGITMGCARCHDHKFDPITQEDYYSWYATFAGVRHGDRELATAAQRARRQQLLAPLQARRAALLRERDEIRQRAIRRAEAQRHRLEERWQRPPVSRYRTEESFQPVAARYVRLVVFGRDDAPESRTDFRIDEFEVWTVRPKPENVALLSKGARADGASRIARDFADAYSAERAIDGDFGTRWIAAGPTLTITLARPAVIGRVVFSSDRPRELPPTHGYTRFICEYRIEVSMDGRRWQTVADSYDRKPVTAAHRRHRLLQAGLTDEERERLSELAAELAAIEAKIRTVPPLPVYWVGRMTAAPGPFHVFLGGDPQRRGKVVVPRSIRVLERTVGRYELPADAPEATRRLALAQWIASDSNSLTLRVLANRIWHYHFGQGIVATPSDFGQMGSLPSHPELLDYLATELLRYRWRLKPLHRMIVLSATYRQQSVARPDALRIDAGTRLLWRYPPRRLTGEEIRDSMLDAAGVLDRRMGGPGFRLYRYLEDNVATYEPLDRVGPETYRRAVYHQNARAAWVDLLSDFDCPDPAFAAPRRPETTSPLQALTLLNHSFVLDMAELMTRRIEREVGTDLTAQVERAFVLLYQRPPDDRERRAALAVARRFGLRAVCRALFNSNEFLYLE